MSFNNFVTPTWVAPNGNIGWSYFFGGVGGRGAQAASADAKTPDSLMWATRQGRRVEQGGGVTYFVDFHNDGPQWCFHNLMGGGYV